MKRLFILATLLTVQACAVGKAVGGVIESVGTGVGEMGQGVFKGVGTVVGGSGRAISDASGQRESVARGMPDARERRVARRY